MITAIVTEHLATREGGPVRRDELREVRVSGPGALDLLQRLCANDVDVRVGRVVYTQMLNRRGGIESDLTVTRLATTCSARDRNRLREQRPRVDQETQGNSDAMIRDATSSLACFGIWGPRARDLLAAVADEDLSNEAFPYMTAREMDVAEAPCFAARVTYVGELGWEPYPPPSSPARLWDS